jgi:ankyrin repeat protein
MVHAVRYGNLKIMELLHATSPYVIHAMGLNGNNLLAINNSGRLIEYLTSKGVEMHHCNRDGEAMINLALGSSRSREFLIRSRLETPPVWEVCVKRENPLSRAVYNATLKDIKRLLLALPPVLAGMLINQEGRDVGTPICIASSRGVLEMVETLIDHGANIEQDGSAFGTPLMCAITCGRLSVVKLLVRIGARLEYKDEDGVRSAMRASLPHPEITHWLLVERFQDQEKLEYGPDDRSASSKPWSGKRVLVVALQQWELRRWGESGFDFCIRLGRLKRDYQGRTVRGEILE